MTNGYGEPYAPSQGMSGAHAQALIEDGEAVCANPRCESGSPLIWVGFVPEGDFGQCQLFLCGRCHERAALLYAAHAVRFEQIKAGMAWPWVLEVAQVEVT